MGSVRGLIQAGVLSSALCALLACSDKPDPVQQRRALLTPPDQAALQKARKEKAALTNAEGELLPGDMVLGGFQVPRGFELMRTYDNEWYLRSLSVSAQRAAEYTQKRLFTGSLVRSPIGGMRFEAATIRDAPSLPKLTVRISPTTSKPNACEMYIQSHAQKVEKLTPEQAEAKVREAARFAD